MTTYGPQPPPPCMLCGSTNNVRHFQIVVDGDPLRLQPFLCSDHGDAYLMRVGWILGEMLRDRGSGDSVPAAVCPECQKSPCIGHPRAVEAPVLNKSGGSQRDEMQCSAFNGDGAPCRRSRVAGASCCEAHGGRLPRLNKSGGSDVRENMRTYHRRGYYSDAPCAECGAAAGAECK